MSRVTLLIVGGLVAAAALYQILTRVPTDALNVALGVACGIAASIPVSFGLLLALTRQRAQNRQEVEWDEAPVAQARVVPSRIHSTDHWHHQQSPQAQQQAPQIIVIAPPQGQGMPGQFPQGFPLPAQWLNQQYPYMHENPEAVDARDWRIIGEE